MHMVVISHYKLQACLLQKCLLERVCEVGSNLLSLKIRDTPSLGGKLPFLWEF